MVQYSKENPQDAIISALPYSCNPLVAELAHESGVHYFGFTEDGVVTRSVMKLIAGASMAFIPQCGLAPDFISMVANELMIHFENPDIVRVRIEDLPIHPSKVLEYSLT